MTLIYRYLFSPRHAMLLLSNQSLLSPILIILALLAFMSSGGFLSGFIIRELFWMAIWAAYVLVLTLCIDFSAQIMGYTAQGKRLFQWFVLSLSPVLLLPPLLLLAEAVPLISEQFSLCLLLVFGYVGFLQFETLRFFYNTSIPKTILLFLSPLLLGIGFVFLCILYLGVAIQGML